MKSAETLEEITCRAEAFAQRLDNPMNSGHLLWAIITGSGVAANTLTLRNLKEGDVRKALRSLEFSEVNPSSVDKVMQTTTDIARSVRSKSPGALHLLAAITTVRECIGFKIITEAGLNVDTIRLQSLKNMTNGLTREHGVSGNQLHLSTLTDVRNISGHGAKQRPREITQVKPVSILANARRKAVGQAIEQAQKKMLKTRNLPVPAVALQEKKAQLASFNASDYPLLFSLGRNLSQEAVEQKYRSIVGRRAEIEQIADVLNKKRANCPCLVGPPGVGKTAIVEGFASDILDGSLRGLKYEMVIEITSGSLLGGTALRGELGEKVTSLVQEVQKALGRIVLFIDDVHTIFSSSEFQEAAMELKKAISSGEIPCIFATTDCGFDRCMNDPSVLRFLSVVEVAEPSEDETKEILFGVAPEYESFHSVTIEDEALKAAVTLSKRYVADSFLPEKAVSIIDLAGAQVSRRGEKVVRIEDIASVLASRIGVPVERLVCTDSQRLLKIEESLADDIIGHTHVLEALGETLRRNAVGFKSNRPIGSFLFLGPTGVGKTETAKSLSKLLFADENAIIRIDMSEYSEAHSIAKLIGAPPGYIGHEEGGQLTDAVRRRPYSLVLLDEIEKSNKDVILALLQVLDDGRLTDGRGRTVDFSNTVIIMTSNLGSDLRDKAMNKGRVGFGNKIDVNENTQAVMDQIFEAARMALPPELWNRIDEPLVFSPLNKDEVNKIAALMLNKIAKDLLKQRNIELAFDEGVIDILLEAGGYDIQLGARPMRRVISKMIEGPLARIILSNKVNAFKIRIGTQADKIMFHQETA